MSTLIACGEASPESTLEDEAAAATVDPRSALKAHTFHVARSILDTGVFEDQGGALVLRLPYAPMKPVFADLARTIANPKLKSRGEAHLTVLTPADVARTGLSMATLIATAQAQDVVDDLELLCLGAGIPDRKPSLQTYYLVARSNKVLAVRRAIAKKSGGRLDADAYHPHVTVGFTSRDLFPEKDGIKDKDVASCPNPSGLVVDTAP